MYHDSFRLLADIARRLNGEEDSPPNVPSVEALSKYLQMLSDAQYLDVSGLPIDWAMLHFSHGFNARQERLYMCVNCEGDFLLVVRSRRYKNAEAPLFALTVSEGLITAASADLIGVEKFRDDLESLDMIFKFVIPALGGFEDILKVTDPGTVHMLKLVGGAYAQRELARRLSEGAEKHCVDEMQAFLEECLHLDIQYTLKRQ